MNMVEEGAASREQGEGRKGQLLRVNAGEGKIGVGSNDENQDESQLEREKCDDTEAD